MSMMTEAQIREKFSTVPHSQAESQKISKGEWYWAKRNGPGVVLCCHEVSKNNFIIPTTAAYTYDTSECFRALDQTDLTLLELHKQTTAAMTAWSKVMFVPSDN